MSADNGIYIAKFPDGYRVAYAQNIDNVDYFLEGTHERKEQLKNYFGDSQLFATEKEAADHAWNMYDEFMKEDGIGYIEYGICSIGEYESFEL